MASNDLVDAVRHWVHFDNLAENLNKQVANVRSLRSQYEIKVLRLLETQGMQNASLKISGATLQRSVRTKPADLNWGMLEEQLHEYFKMHGKIDETPAILAHMHKYRGGKQIEYLKKTPVNKPAQTPTPGSNPLLKQDAK